MIFLTANTFAEWEILRPLKLEWAGLSDFCIFLNGFLVYIFHTLPKLLVSFGIDFKHPNQHFSHVGQNQRFLVVYRHCGKLKSFFQAIYTVKVGIKSMTSRSGALFYHYAIALPTSPNSRQLIRFSIKWLSVSPYKHDNNGLE